MLDDASLAAAQDHELLALHRTILEAKFNGDPNDRDVARSPIVADWANRIVAELERRETAKPPSGHPLARTWAQWRQLEPDGRIWRAALRHARDTSDWARLSVEDRRTRLRDLFAPYVVSLDLEDRFLRAFDEP